MRKFFNVNTISLIAIGLLLLVIPPTVYFLQQQQTLNQHAQLNTTGPYDTCKKLYIIWKENISGASSCTQGQANPNVSSYGVTLYIKSNDGKSHSFHYITYKGFCPTGGLNPPCLQNGSLGTPGDMTVSSTAQTLTIPQQSPATGSNCGMYQDDFVITAIDGSSSCHYGASNSTPFGSSAPGGAGFCPTGKACPVPTGKPTPSPTIPPTVPPTVTLVPTDTPIPTPTFTPTPTATPTPYPTLSPTPTLFPTITPIPTATPTLPPGVTPSPTPTNTPVPTVIVNNPVSPQPTLLATGPADTFITLGSIGGVMLVVGSIIFFLL